MVNTVIMMKKGRIKKKKKNNKGKTGVRAFLIAFLPAVFGRYVIHSFLFLLKACLVRM